MLLAAAVLFQATTAAGLPDPRPANPPATPPANVIILLLDDVGRDKVGLYGVGTAPPPTPHLDALRARGVLFTRAWATQACSPTRAALLTGRSSDRTGIGAVIRPDDGRDTPLPLDEMLLPEALPNHASTHVGKWHLGDEAQPGHHPILSGFDASIGWSGPNDYFKWTERVGQELKPKTGYFPESMAEHAIDAVKQADGPFFLYYATKLGHTPFHDPPDRLHSQQSAPSFPLRQHKAMVEAADAMLGRLLAAVDLETTFVFVMGDNGSPGHTVAPPFVIKKNKGSLFEGGLNVPLIVAGPGVRAGGTCEELVQVTDLFATILELTGHPKPSDAAEDSISFAQLLEDPARKGQRSVLRVHRFPHKGANGPDQTALRTKRWKLIHDHRKNKSTFYDLEADPWETVDLSSLAGVGPTGEEGEASEKRRAMALAFRNLKELAAQPSRR